MGQICSEVSQRNLLLIHQFIKRLVEVLPKLTHLNFRLSYTSLLMILNNLQVTLAANLYEDKKIQKAVTRSFAHKIWNSLRMSIIPHEEQRDIGKLKIEFHYSVKKDFSFHFKSIKDGVRSVDEILSFSLTKRDTI